MASVADVLFGQAAPTEVSFRNKVIGFISLQHVAPTILFLPVTLGTMALAGVQFGDPRLLLVIIIALLGSFAVNVINDIVDMDRDKWKWPQRPLSSGLIPKFVAALYIIIIAAIAVLMAGVLFNWLFATLGLLGGALVYFYAQYARDRIGHLTGALFGGLVPVVLWTAIFPTAILTPIPWLLYALAVCQNAALNFVNESFDPTIKSLFIRFKPSTDMVLYVISIVGAMFFGAIIFFHAPLPLPLPWPNLLAFLLILTAITAWALTQAKHMTGERTQETAKKIFMTLAMYVAIYWSTMAIVLWIK